MGDDDFYEPSPGHQTLAFTGDKNPLNNNNNVELKHAEAKLAQRQKFAESPR